MSSLSTVQYKVCWFWDTNNLNDIADGDNVKLMTKKINGGSIGLEDRQRRYVVAMNVLGTPLDAHQEDDDDDGEDILDDIGVLRRGSRGDGVADAGSTWTRVDGIFGRGTERALINWQMDNGLTPDGVEPNDI